MRKPLAVALLIVTSIFLSGCKSTEHSYRCEGAIRPEPRSAEKPATIFLKIYEYSLATRLWAGLLGGDWVNGGRARIEWPEPNTLGELYLGLKTIGDQVFVVYEESDRFVYGPNDEERAAGPRPGVRAGS